MLPQFSSPLLSRCAAVRCAVLTVFSKRFDGTNRRVGARCTRARQMRRGSGVRLVLQSNCSFENST